MLREGDDEPALSCSLTAHTWRSLQADFTSQLPASTPQRGKTSMTQFATFHLYRRLLPCLMRSWARDGHLVLRRCAICICKALGRQSFMCSALHHHLECKNVEFFLRGNRGTDAWCLVPSGIGVKNYLLISTRLRCEQLRNSH